MALSNVFNQIDYLVIGHITKDLLDDDSVRLGGTVSYSGLTAARLGHQVGMLTSCSSELDLSIYTGIQTSLVPAAETTTFRNITTKTGRLQYMSHRASLIESSAVPALWKDTPIVHLGPVSDEIDPDIYQVFPNSLLCLTPQGWLRSVLDDGRVAPTAWKYSTALLEAAHATVLSFEDLHNDEGLVQQMAALSRILVVTENALGARVYWNGDVRRFPAPQVDLKEDTGAGDIFAACFFHRLYHTRSPWEAARFAVQLAAQSVTRTHFESIPTANELSAAAIQVL